MAWDLLGVGPSFHGRSELWGQFVSGPDFEVELETLVGPSRHETEFVVELRLHWAELHVEWPGGQMAFGRYG